MYQEYMGMYEKTVVCGGGKVVSAVERVEVHRDGIKNDILVGNEISKHNYNKQLFISG